LFRFFGEEDLFGVSCAEPSGSVAGTRVNGLQVTSVEDNLSTLVLESILYLVLKAKRRPD
jgi:hypothetical protein